ncbi:D-aminoacyl-tRNA deacylase [Kocuria rhizophila]|uniref:D-aminoacyl-tRNA deacylase n=1 Tax=Kocuria rhizophila TaxID=72000 RepID=UPI003866199D|nr:D-aminoacyl-tRNA deacylase [Kocuria rhizophila]WSZ54404.1 D-aminoacyl-tRNA deacylase [Kocuria rhizophila]
MRIVLQVVSRAAVTVAGETVGEIEGPGVLALVGVTHTDTPETAARLADKVSGLRILPGETSCADGPSPVPVVSQFTLYGDVRKGRRPSWSRAAPGDVSEPLFEEFVRALRGRGIPVETGRFGAHMEVSLVNDGPMTVLVDSEELDRPRQG